VGGPFDSAPFGYAQDLRQDKPGVRGLGRGRSVRRSLDPLCKWSSSPDTSASLVSRIRWRPETVPEPIRDNIPPDPGLVTADLKKIFVYWASFGSVIPGQFALPRKTGDATLFFYSIIPGVYPRATSSVIMIENPTMEIGEIG